MRSLPVDQRRDLPIPAVTARLPGGEPDFTTVDGRIALRLASEGRCGICGNPLDYWIAFLGGPQALAARAYHDPPMHEMCAEVSTRLCPHLVRRDMRRATSRHFTGVLPAGSAEEKPDRWVMWICRAFAAYVVDGVPVFRPAPYARLRIFSYTADGRLHETPEDSPPPSRTAGGT